MKYLIFVLLSLAACNDDLNVQEGIKLINKIAKKKYDLTCIGSGIQGPNIIKNFRLTFETYKIYTEDEARQLLVQFTEDYIRLINNSEFILKNMDNPPVDQNHAYFLITFIDYDGSYRPQLNAIELSNGSIKFLKKTYTLETYKKESYSEAYFKVYGTQLNRD